MRKSFKMRFDGGNQENKIHSGNCGKAATKYNSLLCSSMHKHAVLKFIGLQF